MFEENESGLNLLKIKLNDSLYFSNIFNDCFTYLILYLIKILSLSYF